MVQERIQAGGELTLSREVLEAAGVHPGDMAEVEVTGPYKIEITVVPDAVVPAERPDTAPPAETAVPGRGDAIDPDTLPILTLEELLERYPIEGPIDIEADREAMYDEAAKDVFGERPERWNR
jgi:hypothetical protein